METESLDDQEVANLATTASNLHSCSSFSGHNMGKGRKHFFFQVCLNFLLRRNSRKIRKHFATSYLKSSRELVNFRTHL